MIQLKVLTIYSDEKDDKGNLKIYILKKRKKNKNNFQITYAKKGNFSKKKNNIQFLTLYEGETINVVNNKITNFKFFKIRF